MPATGYYNVGLNSLLSGAGMGGMPPQATTQQPTGYQVRMPDGSWQSFDAAGGVPKSFISDSFNGGFDAAQPGTPQYQHLSNVMNTNTNQSAIQIAALLGGSAALGGILGGGTEAGLTGGAGAGAGAGAAAAESGASVLGAVPGAYLGAGSGVGFMSTLGGILGGSGGNVPLWGSLISGAGSLLGGKIQGDASEHAADLAAQTAAQNRETQMPFIQSGYAGQGQLNQLLGLGEDQGTGGYGSLTQPFDAAQFNQYKDPGYQFRLQQGEQGLRNAASAGSGALSGAALKDLIGYNQDMASTEYQNAFNRQQTQQGNIFNRLFGVANQGQNAASGVGTTSAALAGTGANAIANAGGAYGAGVVGAGNAASTAATNQWLSTILRGG